MTRSRLRSRSVVLLMSLAGVCMATSVPEAHAGGPPSAQTLERRWVHLIGGTPEYVLADRRGVVTVTHRGRVMAFDPDGREQWDARIPLADDEGISADRASLGQGLVVVPAGEARIVAMDRGSGEHRWVVRMPAVRATAVGRGSDASTLVAATDRAGALDVLDASTGAARWEIVLRDFPPDGAPLPNLWFREGTLLVSWFDAEGSHLASFDAATGSPLWSYDASEFSTIPSVSSRSVSFAENLEVETRHRVSAAVRSLDLATGRTRWSRTVTSRGAFFPEIGGATGEGRVVVLDHRGTARAYDETSGVARWRRATGRAQIAAEPRVAGAVLAIPVLGSQLLGLQMGTGAPADVAALDSVQTSVTIEASTAVGTRLYVLVARQPRGDGEVWAYDAASEPG